MKENYKLYFMAAKACTEVYEKNIRIGMGTEFDHFITNVNGQDVQVIVIAGTDDLIDMVKNINLLSWFGIKLSAYRAAKRIMEKVELKPDLPLIVTGHSLGGTVAIALKKKFKADYCIAFAPARCLRYWSKRKMNNTIIFIDPDDPVSNLLGIVNFGLPKCKTIKAPENHLTPSINDHFMKNWYKFTYLKMISEEFAGMKLFFK